MAAFIFGRFGWDSYCSHDVLQFLPLYFLFAWLTGSFLPAIILRVDEESEDMSDPITFASNPNHHFLSGLWQDPPGVGQLFGDATGARLPSIPEQPALEVQSNKRSYNIINHNRFYRSTPYELYIVMFIAADDDDDFIQERLRR